MKINQPKNSSLLGIITTAVAIAAASTAQAQVQVFNDLSSFQAATASAGMTFMGIEDFEESVVSPGGAIALSDPVDSTPNAGFPTGLAMTNLRLQSNDLGEFPTVPYSNGAGMILLGSGFAGAHTEVLGATIFNDSTDLMFLGGVEAAVGFNVITNNGPSIQVNVYDLSNVLVQQVFINADTSDNAFIGFVSSSPISRINIHDVGLLGELADNIRMYKHGSVGTGFCLGDGSGALCPCGNPGSAGEGCANSTGSGAILTASGSASASTGNLILAGAQLPANRPGLFFGGPLQVNGGNGSLFGDGLLCAGGSLIRLEVVFSSAGGLSSTSVNIAADMGATTGSTDYFQLWYRDPSGPCSSQFNTTNAIEVVWN